ncbi:MAG: hypothetical protein NUV81_03890 [bacterium]|nr:hypothetical protein [bacterium]
MNPKKRLTAQTYLQTIKDRIRLNKTVILTPIQWVATSLAQGVPGTEWKTNKSQLFRKLRFGKKRADLLLCLPGASMGLITMEEALAAGTQCVFFLGTCSSIEGRAPFGSVLFDEAATSVLNPFQEHASWKEISKKNAVDMEVEYLQELAKRKKVPFHYALIVSDAIWKDRWEQPLHTDPEYLNQVNKSLEEITKWIGRIV